MEKSNMKEYLKVCLEVCLELLYPRRCPLCQRVLGNKVGRICPECRGKLPYIRDPYCLKCGKALRKEEQEYCLDCQTGHHLFDRGCSVFLYEKAMRRSVWLMKFQNHREYLDFYAEEIVEQKKKLLAVWKPAVIVPIPMYPKKKRQRGYNQSQLLAEKVSSLTGIPCDSHLVFRIRNTKPQKELTAEERRENLRYAFRVAPDFCPTGPVLLIDDIYTTGATVDALAGTLKEHGVDQIYFLTLCSGKGK